MDSGERRRIEHALRAAGFSVEHETRHTQVWSDGARRFAMPRPGGANGGDSRKADEQRSKLRRMGIAV